MSLLDMYRREVEQHGKKIVQLQRDKGRELANLSGIQKRILSASQAATRASSVSTMQSKLREVERLQKDEQRLGQKVADVEGKIAQETSKQANAQQKVAREEASEFQKRMKVQKQEEQKQERRLREMTGKLRQHDSLHASTQVELKKLKELPEQIKVLFLAANPLDQVQLRLDEEVRNLTDSIRRSKHRDSVQLVSVWAIRPADVLLALNEHSPAIVHFSGHGSDSDEIVFQDDAGNTKCVSKEALVQMMMACSDGIRLVFFNTCYSFRQAEALVEHVDAAIGMNTSISDDAARVFFTQFYSGIGFGHSLEKAFKQAKALLKMEGIEEEDTPQLFVRDGLSADAIYIVKPVE